MLAASGSSAIRSHRAEGRWSLAASSVCSRLTRKGVVNCPHVQSLGATASPDSSHALISASSHHHMFEKLALGMGIVNDQ
jgi:hypothetical protein